METEYDIFLFANILSDMKNKEASVEPVEMNFRSLETLTPFQVYIATALNKICADMKLWTSNMPRYLLDFPYNRYLDQSCIKSNKFTDTRQCKIKEEIALSTWKWKLAYMVVILHLNIDISVDILNGMGYIQHISYFDRYIKSEY